MRLFFISGRAAAVHPARRRLAGLLVLFLAAALAAAPLPAAAQSAPPPEAEALGAILESGAAPLPEIAAALGPQAPVALKGLYAARGNRPLWLGTAGLSPLGADLLDRLVAIGTLQSLPADSLIKAAAALRGAAEPQKRAALELLLSVSLAATAVAPENPLAPASVQDLAAISAPALHKALPVDPGFWRLRGAIDPYAKLAAAGGWGSVPDGPKLEFGAEGPRVEALRRRLATGGDLAEAGSGAFDATLDQAVKHFQARHGLAVDGVVGPATLAALNVPAGERLETLSLNLRRLQAQDRHWGDRYVAVNIAAASYRLVVSGQVVLERAAVVGKPSWPTPTLDSVIDRVEFHPYWRIPMRIAELEVWPKLDADPSYFSDRGIRVIDDQLRQDPGPTNPLGDVKFVFDNPYSVYLHDTTSPSLFAKAYRFSSHGCIRVSDADALARELLASDPAWPAESVDAALGQGGNRTVSLLEPIPVHIVYDTAWVDADGTVQFRADVYHRDRLSTDEVAPAGTPVASAQPEAAPGPCGG